METPTRSEHLFFTQFRVENRRAPFLEWWHDVGCDISRQWLDFLMRQAAYANTPAWLSPACRNLTFDLYAQSFSSTTSTPRRKACPSA